MPLLFVEKDICCEGNDRWSIDAYLENVGWLNSRFDNGNSDRMTNSIECTNESTRISLRHQKFYNEKKNAHSHPSNLSHKSQLLSVDQGYRYTHLYVRKLNGNKTNKRWIFDCDPLRFLIKYKTSPSNIYVHIHSSKNNDTNAY